MKRRESYDKGKAQSITINQTRNRCSCMSGWCESAMHKRRGADTAAGERRLSIKEARDEAFKLVNRSEVRELHKANDGGRQGKIEAMEGKDERKERVGGGGRG
eukprot:2219263-Pleurochrysis_carterae.AAC.1